MARVTTVQVDGLQALGAALRELGNEVGTRIGRGSTMAGAKIIKVGAVAKVESNPSIDEGDLKEAIIIKRSAKGENNLTSEHVVTVRGRGKPYNKKGQKIARAPHAHLVEFGTVNMPAEPVLRPAFDNGKEQAARAIAESLRRGIDRAAKKAAK